jgi:predicted RND superfamily exporter protein
MKMVFIPCINTVYWWICARVLSRSKARVSWSWPLTFIENVTFNTVVTEWCHQPPSISPCLAVFASHPAVVLFISSWIVLALGYGAFSLQVTTDPVEIWAAPDSRSRIEKEYFDSRFEPFYRTEQVFVKAVGIEKVGTPQQTRTIREVELLLKTQVIQDVTPCLMVNIYRRFERFAIPSSGSSSPSSV